MDERKIPRCWWCSRETYPLSTYQLAHGPGVFCSEHCAGEWVADEAAKKAERIYKCCQCFAIVGTNELYRIGNRKFCSRQCTIKWGADRGIDVKREVRYSLDAPSQDQETKNNNLAKVLQDIFGHSSVQVRYENGKITLSITVDCPRIDPVLNNGETHESQAI